MTSPTLTKTVIALFDFDGTITTRDTFVDFLFYTFGQPKVIGTLMRHVFQLIAWKVGLIPAEKVKSSIFRSLCEGMTEAVFLRTCCTYAEKRLPSILDSRALAQIAWHRQNSHTLVIASASLQTWIQPWADANGFRDVIATIPESREGVVTGNFVGKNCAGPEKLRRFTQVFTKRDEYILYMYSDNRSDRALLDMADHAYYKTFPQT